jgi:hypothetical protein
MVTIAVLAIFLMTSPKSFVLPLPIAINKHENFHF